MKVQFIGAAQTVTGSKTYITLNKMKFLVDCGMYQGTKSVVDKNYSSLSFDAKELDCIFLTHGHLDHSGLIPRLYKEGFRGKIVCSHTTKKIAEIIMLDSARIQVSDFLKHKKDKTTRKELKKNKEVLYDEIDVHRCLELFETFDYNIQHTICETAFTLRPAGHILGASAIEICHGPQITYFSGDIGRFDDPMENRPYIPSKADNLFMETTYGDRLHDKEDPVEQLKDVLQTNKKKQGKILIPSFAVARTQLLLLYIYKLFEKYPDLKIPVYVDSPMTKKVTDLYLDNPHELRPSRDELESYFGIAKFLKWEHEFKKLKRKDSSYIVISASGMVSGGKVLKYLDTIARKEENTILLVGFQGEKTIGRELSQGSKTVVALGSKIPIRAQVKHLHTLSAHADKEELTKWIREIEKPPANIILMHGEKETIQSFKEHLSDKAQGRIIIAKENEIIDL